MTEREDESTVHVVASCLGLSTGDVGSLLPAPIAAVDIDGAPPAQWFAAGEPVLVLLGIGEDSVYVGEPVIRWQGAHTPQLDVSGLSEFTTRGVAADEWRATLAAAIERSTAARVRRFRTCTDCGQSTPPEWLHSATLCDGCAERNHGVVH